MIIKISLNLQTPTNFNFLSTYLYKKDKWVIWFFIKNKLFTQNPDVEFKDNIEIYFNHDVSDIFITNFIAKLFELRYWIVSCIQERIYKKEGNILVNKNWYIIDFWLVQAYKWYFIIKDKNWIIEVVSDIDNPNLPSRYIVSMNDSKNSWKREFDKSSNTIQVAKEYINYLLK